QKLWKIIGHIVRTAQAGQQPCAVAVAGGAGIPSQQSPAPHHWLGVLPLKNRKEKGIYCAMEAKQLWLHFSIVFEGNHLDKELLTTRYMGFIWPLHERCSFGIFSRGKKSLQLNAGGSQSLSLSLD
uniref:Uncharacterized protein n=1 Tax=Zonotrichia albicollis TaxID=44394 RepID=A0A8D2NL02_ZONAL